MLNVEVVALLVEVGGDRALEDGVVALERATGRKSIVVRGPPSGTCP